MKGVNKFIGIGNSVKDPEVRHMPNGGQVTNITIAINDSYKDKQTGQIVDKAEFVRVVFFGKLAEIAGEYLRKGSKVYIEGKIATRKWQDQSGADRYSTEIVCDGFGGTLQMLDSKPEGGYQNNQNQGHRQQQQGSQSNQSGHQNGNQHQGQHQGQGNYDDADSIPF